MSEETKAPAPAVEGSAPSERPRFDGPRHDGPRSGPRFGSRSGPGGPPREGGRKFFRRKKVCKFCVEKIENINYKDYRMLGGAQHCLAAVCRCKPLNQGDAD